MNPHLVICRAGAAFVATLLAALALSSSVQAQSRGELLYSTHCISCHTTDMHWRDKKAASDSSKLNAQVRRWQDASGLSWSDSDIRDVARYLNESIYRYPPMADPVARLAPSVRDAPPGVSPRR